MLKRSQWAGAAILVLAMALVMLIAAPSLRPISRPQASHGKEALAAASMALRMLAGMRTIVPCRV